MNTWGDIFNPRQKLSLIMNAFNIMLEEGIDRNYAIVLPGKRASQADVSRFLLTTLLLLFTFYILRIIHRYNMEREFYRCFCTG